MAKVCAACGKGSQVEWKRKLLRGHYNPTTKRRKYANLQWIRLNDGRRVKVCTTCRRTANKDPKYLEKNVAV